MGGENELHGRILPPHSAFSRMASPRDPVTLAEMKANPAFAESPLVRQGRLSVVPLTAAQWKAIEGRGGS